MKPRDSKDVPSELTELKEYTPGALTSLNSALTKVEWEHAMRQCQDYTLSNMNICRTLLENSTSLPADDSCCIVPFKLRKKFINTQIYFRCKQLSRCPPTVGVLGSKSMTAHSGYQSVTVIHTGYAPV